MFRNQIFPKSKLIDKYEDYHDYGESWIRLLLLTFFVPLGYEDCSKKIAAKLPNILIIILL